MIVFVPHKKSISISYSKAWYFCMVSVTSISDALMVVEVLQGGFKIVFV